MAEFIQKTDTLNQGREKLNEAIKDADKAKMDAGSAVSTSNTARQIANQAEETSNQAKSDAEAALQYTVGKYLEPVDTYSDISTTYPDAVENDRVFVRDTGKVYIRQSGTWQEFSEITAGPVNEVDKRLTAQVADIVISVKNFGAVADGVTDSTTAIQNALDFLKTKGGGKLIFPYSNQPYLISKEISIVNFNNFEIEGNNSTIMYAAGAPVQGGYAGIKLTNCYNFSIKNLKIDGNRVNRTPAEKAAHLIYIMRCGNFILDNVLAVNGVCDGFLITATDKADASTYSKHAKVTNCVADNNFRQGLTLGNVIDVVIENSRFDNTNGTNPETGIDVEPDTGYASGIRVSNCSFSNNNGRGLLFTKNTWDSVVEKSTFINNKESGCEVVHSRNIKVADCSFNDYTVPTIRSVMYVRNSENITIENNSFLNVKTGQACINLFSDTKNCIVINNVIENSDGGILPYGESHLIKDNQIKNIQSAGITTLSTSKDIMISGNQIINTVARAIYDAGINNSIINNTIIGVANVSGGLIHSTNQNPGNVIGNHIEQPISGTDIGVRFSYSPKFVMNNKLVGVAAISSLNGFSDNSLVSFNDVNGEGANRQSSLDIDGKKVIVSTNTPSTGTWKTGDIVLRRSPALGTSMGWICISGGSPGTWVQLAPIGAVGTINGIPNFVGQLAVVGSVGYIAVGTNSSSDWKQISN